MTPNTYWCHPELDSGSRADAGWLYRLIDSRSGAGMTAKRVWKLFRKDRPLFLFIILFYFMKHVYSDVIVILSGIIAGYVFLFSNAYLDLITAALVGVALIAIQKENTSIRFIPRLAIGSVIFGIGVFVLYAAVFYFFERNTEMIIKFFKDIAFGPIFFAAISFIAGLLTIVVRGFWSMKK